MSEWRLYALASTASIGAYAWPCLMNESPNRFPADQGMSLSLRPGNESSFKTQA